MCCRIEITPLLADVAVAQLTIGQFNFDASMQRWTRTDASARFEQVLITAAVFDDVPEALASHVVRIRAGRVIDDAD